MTLIVVDEPESTISSGRLPAPPYRASRLRRLRQKQATAVAGHLVMTALGLFALAPIAWMVLSSLRRHDAVFAAMLPLPPDLANYCAALAALPWMVAKNP